MEPGIYTLSNSVYQASPGISKHGLDLIHKSPAHYHQSVIGAASNRRTPAMVFGSLLHTMVLEREQFENLYAIEPDGINKRTKAGQEEYAAWLTEIGEKEVVSRDDYALSVRMSDAIHEHSVASKLLSVGRVEQSVFWTDKATGCLCRCRPDNFRDDGIITDLKSTQDASREAFMRQSWSLRYHVQGAFYRDGLQAATGIKIKSFCAIAIEKEPPYAIAMYMFDHEQFGIGEREYRKDLELYHACKKADAWPGYPAEFQPLGVPVWAQ